MSDPCADGEAVTCACGCDTFAASEGSLWALACTECDTPLPLKICRGDDIDVISWPVSYE